MKVNSYYYTDVKEEVLIGGTYYFGQLTDGNGEIEELLKFGHIAVYDDDIKDYQVVAFDIVEENEDIFKTKVKVTDIYLMDGVII